MTNLDLSNNAVKISDKTSPSPNNKINKLGVYLVKINGYKSSSDISGYNKSPFLKFECIDVATQKAGELMFWLPKENASLETNNIKLKILKEFMLNCGCDTEALKGNDLLNCAINKQVKVALKQRERMVMGSKDGKPLIVSEIDYWYSGKPEDALTVNESKMYLPLNEAQKQQYDALLLSWNQANNIETQEIPPPGSNIDLSEQASQPEFPKEESNPFA